jgi:hypothetical protein
MVFQPGQSGNPFGRARHIDPRSEDLRLFCKEYREDIKKIGEIVLERAIEGKEPWALKLGMEYFYPRPGTAVFISKEENKQIDINLSSFADSLSFEDKQLFLELWMKSKRGTPAFNNTIEIEASDASQKDE